MSEIYDCITKIDTEIDEIVEEEIEYRVNLTAQQQTERSTIEQPMKSERSNFTEQILPSKQNFIEIQNEEISDLKKFQ